MSNEKEKKKEIDKEGEKVDEKKKEISNKTERQTKTPSDKKLDIKIKREKVNNILSTNRTFDIRDYIYERYYPQIKNLVLDLFEKETKKRQDLFLQKLTIIDNSATSFSKKLSIVEEDQKIIIYAEERFLRKNAIREQITYEGKTVSAFKESDLTYENKYITYPTTILKKTSNKIICDKIVTNDFPLRCDRSIYDEKSQSDYIIESKRKLKDLDVDINIVGHICFSKFSQHEYGRVGDIIVNPSQNEWNKAIFMSISKNHKRFVKIFKRQMKKKFFV